MDKIRQIVKRLSAFTSVSVLIIAVIVPGGTAIAHADASFIDIGTFQPTAINIHGEVVGSSCCKLVASEGNNEYQQAILWSPNTGVIDLAKQLDSTGSEAMGINDQGAVVGDLQFSNRTRHAFMWTPSSGMTDLGTLGGSSSTAHAINNEGTVVGESDTANGGHDAFMWTPAGGMLDLGNLGGSSFAYAVNNNNEVVGDSFNTDGTTDHAFSWTLSTGMVDLGTLVGVSGISQALGVNDSGEVVGGSSTNMTTSDGARVYHAVYWSAQGVINDLGDFGVPGAQGSFAYGVNSDGEMIGYVDSQSNGNSYVQPFAWTPAGGTVILPAYESDFGTSGTYTTREIAYAVAINDDGTIVGDGLKVLNELPRALMWGPLANMSVPLGLAAASPTQTPSLTWSTVSGATSYNIYRDGTSIASSATNSYVDSNASEGNHTYYVTAVGVGGESSPSNTASVLVDRTLPTVGTPSWSVNPLLVGSSTTLSAPANDTSGSGVIGGEYYLGASDPGQGNGVPMTYSGSSISATFGASLTPGIYTVNIRAEDAAGNWSSVTTDYLVVYNPASGGITGHSNTMLPVYGTDVLPGLIQAAQPDTASFALSVKYDNNGNITSNSKVKFSYNTGSHCNNASQATNCHSLALDSTSITWLLINGTNNSEGAIQGIATLTVDGVTTTNPFRVVGADGGLLSPQTGDMFTVQIFAPGADPNTATPLYHLNAGISKGSVKIS